MKNAFVFSPIFWVFKTIIFLNNHIVKISIFKLFR